MDGVINVAVMMTWNEMSFIFLILSCESYVVQIFLEQLFLSSKNQTKNFANVSLLLDKEEIAVFWRLLCQAEICDIDKRLCKLMRLSNGSDTVRLHRRTSITAYGRAQSSVHAEIFLMFENRSTKHVKMTNQDGQSRS